VLRQSPITRAMGKKLEEVAGRPNRCAHQLAHLRTNAVARDASISFWQAASRPGGASRHAPLNDSGTGSLTSNRT
jgi:hypothetical protein